MNVAYTLRLRMQNMAEQIEELQQKNESLRLEVAALRAAVRTDSRPHLGGDAAEVVRDLAMEGYRKRSQYPSDGAVVRGLVHTADAKVVIIYDDDSYLVVEKTFSGRAY